MRQTAFHPAGSLAVSLSESQGHAAQEFIKGDVGLGGEVLGVHVGDHHENAVGQDLRVTEETGVWQIYGLLCKTVSQ